MRGTMTESLALSCRIMICNFESNRCTKLEKSAENRVDHSKGPRRVDAKFF